NSAWFIKDEESDEDPYLWDIRIHGDVITQLLNNKYLEDQVLSFYCYTLFHKRRIEKDLLSIQHRYAETAFMKPAAW
ncbi:hypothetical protein MKX03_010118, partial [Papaver bracteatum]